MFLSVDSTNRNLGPTVLYVAPYHGACRRDRRCGSGRVFHVALVAAADMAVGRIVGDCLRRRRIVRAERNRVHLGR